MLVLFQGINIAEFEFPAYYNFFVLRRRVNLITTPSVAALIRSIFQETLLGPLPHVLHLSNIYIIYMLQSWFVR